MLNNFYFDSSMVKYIWQSLSNFCLTTYIPIFLISSSVEPNLNRTELLQFVRKKLLEMPLLIDSDFSSLCNAQTFITIAL